MDPFSQAQSNIYGSYNGNKGNNNVFGSNNITNYNTYLLPNATNVGVGNRSGEFEARDAARPYLLIPYGRNGAFTGRKNLLESVKGISGRNGHNRIALYGLGGSGKTQIALEYVYQRARESDCDIFWVQGSGVLKFTEGYRAIAQHVGIHSASTGSDEQDFLLGVRRWFESPKSGNWILVIDNADNETDSATNDSPITKFIPQGTKGTLIFTTRSLQVASRQGCQMVEVVKMGEEEAKELFSKRFGKWGTLEAGEKKVVTKILASLDHLPLVVVGSAAFMIETVTSPSDYWAIFQENEQRMKKLLSEEFNDIQREAGVTESILSTYFATFNRIRQQMPFAANLLWLMAFIDRQNIPEKLLRCCGLEGVGDSVDFRRAIGKLLGFSLVTVIKRENKTFYELHRLVQLSLQVYLPTEDLNQWKATALQVVSRCFPQDESQRRRIGPAYISHALTVTKDSTDPIAEKLCFHMGQYFLDMGSYNNAEMQFHRCVVLRAEGKECDSDEESLMRWRFLGEAKLRQGKYGESEEMTRRAMEGFEKVLGPDHLETLSTVHNLAWVLYSQGRYHESETVNRRALEGFEKVLGPDHPVTLSSVNSVAALLYQQGRYNESETMHRRALEVLETVSGPDHPDTLVSVKNLAGVLRKQGRYDESATAIRRAVEGREKVLGPDHPDTLSSISSLATVLYGQGRYNESEMMSRRALEGLEKVLGLDHPDTLLSVHNLAAVLGRQGRYNEAETMNRRALEGFKKVLGPDHPNTLSSSKNLARVLKDLAKYGGSGTVVHPTLEGHERVLRRDHPTRASASNLPAQMEERGTSDELETMNRPTQENPSRKLGRTRPGSTGRRVLRFLKTVVFGGGHGRTK